MPLLEISLRCRASEQLHYQTALEEVGALAVTLLDADAGTNDEQAILEPGVGQTPLWDSLTLTALFSADTDPLLLLAALDTFDPALDWSAAELRRVDDQDWERVWMDAYQPLLFGERTWIVPWNRALPDAASASRAAVVRLDPGLAFGSGTHPTTALCLEWLDTLAAQGRLDHANVLDFGCGSGILALAALKLGAARAMAIDNDPQAIDATRDNAARNGVATQLQAAAPDAMPAMRYAVGVANILASALDALAPVLAQHLEVGGRLALSGILCGQEDALLTRYLPWFDALQVQSKDGWVRIDGVRNTGGVVE